MRKNIPVAHCLFFSALLQVTSSYSQNVGIGTNSPAYKLDVGGRMRIKTGTIGNVSTSSGFWMEDYRDGTNQAFFGMQDSIRLGFYGANGGVGWAFNFNTVSGDINVVSGSVGIGTATPGYDVHLYRANSSIGFFDNDADNHFSGSINGDSANLYINAYRKSSVGTNSAGDLILQTNSGGFPSFLAGNIGVGTSTPEEKLHISGNVKLQGSAAQLIFKNSTADRALLYLSGNDIKLGTVSGNTSGRVIINTNGTDQLAVTSAGEMNRLTQTGSADILPIAYGKISGAGVLLNSTGNFTVSKTNTGVYKITLTNELNVYANRNNYTILVTAAFGFSFEPVMVNATIVSDNTIEIRTNAIKIYFSNSSCSQECGPYSLINSTQFYDEVDNEFSIIVYKH
jgi:hypothetical protein